MNQRRLAVVGLGRWAATGHLPVYRGARLRDHVEVVGLCSSDPQRAALAAKEWGVPQHGEDLAELIIRSGIDTVAVCTADDAHADAVVTALRHGCDVLVEKPLAMSLDDVRLIDRARRGAGRSVLVMHHKRADPLWAEAASTVRGGDLGAVQMGTALIANPETVPVGGYFRSDMATRTDPNWFLGSHFYDLLRFITGLDPIDVRARRFDGRLQRQHPLVTDAVKADLTFAGGASFSVLTAWNLPPGDTLTTQQMLLHFEAGQLELDGTRRGFTRRGPDGVAQVNPHFLRATPGGPAGYGAAFLEQAVLSLLGRDDGSVSLPSFEDAWWAVAMAEAVAQSASADGAVFAVEPPEVAP